jgi:spore coat protein A
MKKKHFKMTRRQVLKAGLIGGAGMMLPLRFLQRKAFGEALISKLSDPRVQPKFEQIAPNALDPTFLFHPLKGGNPRAGQFNLSLRQTSRHYTGLRRNGTGPLLNTKIWGYGDDDFVSWPGRTLSITRNSDTTKVRWNNELPYGHLLPVDTNLHWCYSLHPDPNANNVDYRQYTIKDNGVPIVTHLHGGHTAFEFDGNPEYFYTPDYDIVGPSWYREGLNGVVKDFEYDNNVQAGTLWYHDHALGITRLNVYAGLAGFYFVRDTLDTGLPGNPLGLPAFPYELAYAIQDRMFTKNGDLFYPAFPGDPFYEGFIIDEGAALPPDLFPRGGPTALAEFFGDHMVVNGKIWPKENVEPRKYRLRLLNGSDSRFMVIRFRAAASLTATDLDGAGGPIDFHVIGSDQGLASSARMVDTLVFEPGSRYDIVFDFSTLAGKRIIMENLGWDAPFGGDYGRNHPDAELFPDSQTDRIMAFDVVLPLDTTVPDSFDPSAIGSYTGNMNTVNRVRKVALFEGKDEFGRLQPLLGTAEPATDANGDPIYWPNTQPYIDAGLAGNQMQGAIPWHSPTTENPAVGATEIWEIYNATEDAHPVHLHLVNFQVGTGDPAYPARQFFTADVVPQPVVQHAGSIGQGFRLENISLGASVNAGPEYVENAPKDMVTALPGQVTRIKMTFDQPGLYVWHCHILSHEDHEMMRRLKIG